MHQHWNKNEEKNGQFKSEGPPTFLGMEVKFFPVAMVMMELWGGLPRSEILEKGKLSVSVMCSGTRAIVLLSNI